MSPEIVFAPAESPEGGCGARVLEHAVFTEADPLDDLRAAVRDAVAAHSKPAERPSVVRLHFVRGEPLAA